MSIAIKIDEAVRNISDIYYGDRAIDKVYYGSSLVYDALKYLQPVEPQPVTPTPTAQKTAYYLLVGMDTYKGNRIAKSSGHVASVNLIKDALLKYNIATESQIHVLTEAQTTKQNVVNCLSEAVTNDFCFFFVNTHGGASTNDKNKDEQEYDFEGANAKDGKFSLYDADMLDDEFWNIIKNAKDRVFNIFCTCHSGTMFRAVNPYATQTTNDNQQRQYNLGFGEALEKYMMPKKRQTRLLAAADPRTYNETALKMINWSACSDALVSYRNNKGHFLAQAISKLYNINQTYSELSYAQFWNKLTTKPTKPADYKTNTTAKAIYDAENQAYNWAHHEVTPILNVLGDVSQFENMRVFT